MTSKFTTGQLTFLLKEMKNLKPLFIFMGEDEKVLDAEWFDDLEQAIEYARTLDAPVVNVLLYVGAAENENESFHMGTRKASP